MAAYRRVYDSRHLQADCQEPGSAPEPYARQSSTGYLFLFVSNCTKLQKLVWYIDRTTSHKTKGLDYALRLNLGINVKLELIKITIRVMTTRLL